MKFLKPLKIGVISEQVNVTAAVEKIIFKAVDVKFTELVSRTLGFSYELTYPADGERGRQLPNGTWTGLVGMVQRGEIDLAITTMAVTEDRMKATPWSYPFSCITITFVTHKPVYKPEAAEFLKPFSLTVWMCLVICFAVGTFLFHAVTRKRYNFQRVALSTYGTFLFQRLIVKPQRASEYIAVSQWNFWLMFLSYSYMALLLSFLTFPTLDGVRTIKELSAAIADGKYQSSTYPGTFFPNALINSSDPVMQIIGHDLKKNKHYWDIEAGLVMKEHSKMTAMVLGSDILPPYEEKYFISKDSIFFIYLAIPMRKNFCCKAKLNKAIHDIWAAGLYKKITDEDNYLTKIKINSYAPKEVRRKLSVIDFKGAFIILIAGHTLSVLVLLTELIVKNRQILNK